MRKASDTTPFIPCSPKHKSCNKFHADMVREYQRERERQETAHDGLWDAYGTGEYEVWKDSGGQLITFTQWLTSHKGHGTK